MINADYSFKDFSETTFNAISADDFNNTEIIGSCFYQENDVNVDIFPDGLQNVTFTRCNLDNVKIKSGMRLIDCSNRHIKVQTDGHDWELNKNNGKPVVPLTPDHPDPEPKHLPLLKLQSETITEEQFNALYANGLPSDSWYKNVPTIDQIIPVEITKDIALSDYNRMRNTRVYAPFIAPPDVLKSEGKRVVVKGQINTYAIAGEVKLHKDKAKKVQTKPTKAEKVGK